MDTDIQKAQLLNQKRVAPNSTSPAVAREKAAIEEEVLAGDSRLMDLITRAEV